LINVGGQDQLVLHVTGRLIGVEPANGGLLWEREFPQERNANVIMTPVWNGEDTLLCSSRELSRAFRLTISEGRTVVEELWSNRRAPLGMGTPVLLDGMAVGSKPTSGGMQQPVLAVDIETGKRLWLKRVFPAMTAVGGGDKLLLLDHTGQLGLVTVTREGLTTTAQHRVTQQWSFTPPTLVGTTLYVRDERHVMALDLGTSADEAG
jgi:hypothetical protein